MLGRIARTGRTIGRTALTPTFDDFSKREKQPKPQPKYYRAANKEKKDEPA
jgi:hypothetical protein